MNSGNNDVDRVSELLAAAGLALDQQQQASLNDFTVLIVASNESFGLCSRSDAAEELWSHVVDSLSLLPYILKQDGDSHLDIGSGGGFPALVLAIALPHKHFTLVERSSGKCSFLRLAGRRAGLSNVDVVCGEYPRAVSGRTFATMTARAIEQPERIAAAISEALPAGAVFLCQSGRMVPVFDEMFHVERVEDDWTRLGLRRGDLWQVRRK